MSKFVCIQRASNDGFLYFHVTQNVVNCFMKSPSIEQSGCVCSWAPFNLNSNLEKRNQHKWKNNATRNTLDFQAWHLTKRKWIQHSRSTNDVECHQKWFYKCVHVDIQTRRLIDEILMRQSGYCWLKYSNSQFVGFPITNNADGPPPPYICGGVYSIDTNQSSNSCLNFHSLKSIAR